MRDLDCICIVLWRSRPCFFCIKMFSCKKITSLLLLGHDGVVVVVAFVNFRVAEFDMFYLFGISDVRHYMTFDAKPYYVRHFFFHFFNCA